MKEMKNLRFPISLPAGLLLLFFSACITDPVIPPEGIYIPPPTQDPGEENICVDGVISFEHQVLPIMVSACAYSGCHDVLTAEEGVILDTYENVRKEVSPGNPNDSELYKSITEGGDIMPPPPAMLLTGEQIGIIREWIVQGAPNTDCGTACDSTLTSFSMDIYPLLLDYCVGCHSSSRQDGGVDLSSYDKVTPYVNNGALLGTIREEQYYPIMPPSGSSFSLCRINQIQKWITEGAQNN